MLSVYNYVFTFIKLSPNSYMVFCGIIAVDIILCMHQHLKKIQNTTLNTPILLLGRLAFYLYYVRYSTTQQSRASLFSLTLLLNIFSLQSLYQRPLSTSYSDHLVGDHHLLSRDVASHFDFHLIEESEYCK